MRFLILLLLFILSISFSRAETSDDKLVHRDTKINTEVIVDGLNHPWSIEFLPGDEFLVTERAGRLLRISADRKKWPIDGLPKIYTKGQGGLLDIIRGEDNLVYFSYAAADPDNPNKANTEVARALLDLKKNALRDLDVVFRAEPKVKGNNHWGSRLLLTDDGNLFVTLGERFEYRDQAQNPGNDLGTIVQITDEDTFAKVYTYGHRNVQGIAINPETGEIWAHEHGPKGGDEVNIIKKGLNYGWPKVSYGTKYSGQTISATGRHAPKYEGPILYWTPSIAPSGMMFYTGDEFPEWKNDLFVGALAGKHLRRVKFDGTFVIEQEELLEDLDERIRDVAQGPDGHIYVLTDSDNGKLIKLSK